MSVTAPAASRASGLSTVLDVITAPTRAFATLRDVPMWGWAYVISAILAMIGQWLAAPGAAHALQAGWPAQMAANPKTAALTPAQQQQALNFALATVHWAWLFLPVFVLVSCLLVTVIMLVFKAAARSDASFKQLWCAAMNTLVVSYGLYSLLQGLIATTRGAASMNSMYDVLRLSPSLAWLAPSAPMKLTAFLAAFNVMSIWGAVLLAIAMIYVARVSKVNAIACAVVTTVLAGAYFAATTR